jgi:hypothetical protein
VAPHWSAPPGELNEISGATYSYAARQFLSCTESGTYSYFARFVCETASETGLFIPEFKIIFKITERCVFL